MSTRLLVPLMFPLMFPMLLGTAAAQEAPTLPSRAQRDADNPLRMIIEASKIKPRARAAEPPPRPPERTPVRARVAAPLEGASAPVTAAEAPAALPAPARAAEQSVVTAPPAEPGRTDPESLVREVVVTAPPVEPATPIVAKAAAAVPPEPLRLANMVEPTVPRRLLDRVRGVVEVVVSFTVNADGSVANAAVQSSTNRLVNPTVLNAVAQWRYAPIAAAREHAVQLMMQVPD